MADMHRDKGEMTTREAGEKGGERTAATHGHEFYSAIGKKGGAKGGKIGGQHTAETHGHQFYEEIGKKGGEKVRELVERGKKLEEEK